MRRPALVAIALTLLAACDIPSLHKYGYVHDERGQPVADAELRLFYGWSDVGSARTDSLGRFLLFTFSPVSPPINIQACAPGYQLERQGFAALDELPDTLRFVLAAAPVQRDIPARLRVC